MSRLYCLKPGNLKVIFDTLHLRPVSLSSGRVCHFFKPLAAALHHLRSADGQTHDSLVLMLRKR